MCEIWEDLGIKRRFELIHAVAQHQESWASVSFAKYECLYFPEDIDGDLRIPLEYEKDGVSAVDTKYAIGPSIEQRWFDDGRNAADLNRGPCKLLLYVWEAATKLAVGDSSEAYHVALGHREVASAKSLPLPAISLASLFGPGTYQPTKETKLRALECYLSLIKYLLPTDRTLQSLTFMHTYTARASLSMPRTRCESLGSLVGGLSSYNHISTMLANHISRITKGLLQHVSNDHRFLQQQEKTQCRRYKSGGCSGSLKCCRIFTDIALTSIYHFSTKR